MFSLRMKFLAGLSGLLAILIAVTLLANSVLLNYSRAVGDLFAQDYDSAADAQAMKESVEHLVQRADALTSEPGATSQTSSTADADIAAFEHKLALQRKIANLPGEAALTRSLAESWAHFLTTYRSVSDVRMDSVARRARIAAELRPAAQQVRHAAQQIIDMNLTDMEAGRGAAREMTRRAQRTMHLLALGGIALAAALVLWAGLVALRPLRSIEQATRQIARGDLELTVPIRAQDEIGQLARAFNDMAAQLREFKRIDHEKLLRTQRTTQLAIDSLPDAVALIEPRGHLELVNETARRLFALQPGNSVVDLPSPWLSDLHQQAMEAKGPQRPSELAAAVQIEDDGVVRWFLPRTFPILDDARRVIGSTIMLADVTELRRLDEIKNHLLATAAHELKTPLTSIRMAVHLVAEERVGTLNERQAGLLSAAMTDSDRLHRIVETLLDIDRIRSGAAIIHLEPIVAQNLALACIEPLKERIERAGIDLCMMLPPEPVMIRADLKRMQHVFANVIDNAIRFTAAGGSIAVSVRGVGDTAAQFSIADTGRGIPDHLQSRVFERFFRAPGQSGDSGSGLGLAIVREIVEAHGGKVWLESREGRGTSVQFVLPLHSNSEQQEFNHVHAHH